MVVLVGADPTWMYQRFIRPLPLPIGYSTNIFDYVQSILIFNSNYL